MPEPHDYRLLLNLKAALQAISVAAGFFYTVDDAAVKLDAEHGVEELIAPNGPRPFVLIELRAESWEYHPSGEVLYTLPLTVHWVHTPAPMDDVVLNAPTAPEDEDRLRFYCRGVADIEQALASDAGRAGLSVDTRITGRRWNPTTGGQDVWAEIDVELSVYRRYGVPA